MIRANERSEEPEFFLYFSCVNFTFLIKNQKRKSIPSDEIQCDFVGFELQPEHNLTYKQMALMLPSENLKPSSAINSYTPIEFYGSK